MFGRLDFPAALIHFQVLGQSMIQIIHHARAIHTAVLSLLFCTVGYTIHTVVALVHALLKPIEVKTFPLALDCCEHLSFLPVFKNSPLMGTIGQVIKLGTR